MSKFEQGRAYMIVLDELVTTEMVNLSVSRTLADMPLKSGALGAYRLVEVVEPIPSIFNSFTWLSINEINAAWEDLT